MLRLLSVLVLSAALLAITPGVFRASAQPDGPRFEVGFDLPGSRNGPKKPQIAASADRIAVTANPNEDVVYWSKGALEDSFSDPRDLGDAAGPTNQSTVAVAIGPDGSAYVAWANKEDQAIYLRRKRPGQDWARRTVVKQGSFVSPGPVTIDMAVTSNGTIFVTWRETDKPTLYTYSRDGGNSFTPRAFVGDTKAFIGAATLATGPNGSVAVAFSTEERRDVVTIQVGIWNGNGFDIQRVSPLPPSSTEVFADPTIAFDSTGKIHVAWRSVAVGIFYAVQQGNGWQVSRLTETGSSNGRVALAVDQADNVHVGWARPGTTDFYYVYQPAGGSFTGPFRAKILGGLINDPEAVATLGDRSYAHFALERFSGDGTKNGIRYLRWSGPVALPASAQPVIEGGAAIIVNTPTLSVAFNGVAGEPNQVRYRWGAPPDDTDAWQAFANPLAVPPPANLDVTSCAPTTLYTQVRNTATASVDEARSAAITIDGSVETNVAVVNPYTSRKSATVTPLTPATPTQDPQGATDGDPRYTRVPAFNLELNAPNECSGLKDFAVSAAGGAFGPTYTVENNTFANTLSFPNQASLVVGPNNLVVRVTDKVGNVLESPQTIIYDDVKPQIATPGTLTAVSDPQASIITTLTISGTTVTDNLYPGKQFWGVWIANSRTPVADPTNDPGLNWVAVSAPNDSTPYTVNWSLASGLSADQLTPGDYVIYLRFLDGAGNPSDQFLTATLNVTEITRPQLYQPLVAR